LEKFPQPGCEGILNPHRVIKRAVLLEKLVQQGHKLKNISETVYVYIVVYLRHARTVTSKHVPAIMQQ
jgi:hypothetical protein